MSENKKNGIPAAPKAAGVVESQVNVEDTSEEMVTVIATKKAIYQESGRVIRIFPDDELQVPKSKPKASWMKLKG